MGFNIQWTPPIIVLWHLVEKPHKELLSHILKSCLQTTMLHVSDHMSPEPVFIGGAGGLSLIPSSMVEHNHGFDASCPKIWLEFRTYDDGHQDEQQSKETTRHSFPQFSQLPPELRLKIWSYLVQPRVVVACCLYNDDNLQRRRQNLDRLSRGSNTPAILQINRESRSVGLNHYEPTFGTNETELAPWRPDPNYLPPARPATIWFNFELDTLWLNGEVNTNDLETPADWSYWYGLPLLRFLKPEDTARIRNVACAVSELGWPRDGTMQIMPRLWSIFRRFPLAQHVPLTVGRADDARIEGAKERHLTDMWGQPAVHSEMDTAWNGWLTGTTVMVSVGDGRKVLLVREEDLSEFLESRL